MLRLKWKPQNSPTFIISGTNVLFFVHVDRSDKIVPRHYTCTNTFYMYEQIIVGTDNKNKLLLYKQYHAMIVILVLHLNILFNI